MASSSPPPFQPQSPPPMQSRNSGNRMLIGILLGCGGLVALVVVGGFGVLVWLGMSVPDTSIYPGEQIPARFMNAVRDTGVLDGDEEVLFLYSDALTEITEGFYLLTDRKIVLYSNAWEEPAILVPFEDIAALDVEYNKSFFEDSQISVTRHDGSLVSVPVSSDYDRDELFFETLVQKWEASR